jgi:hypothetical protein
LERLIVKPHLLLIVLVALALLVVVHQAAVEVLED